MIGDGDKKSPFQASLKNWFPDCSRSIYSRYPYPFVKVILLDFSHWPAIHLSGTPHFPSTINWQVNIVAQKLEIDRETLWVSGKHPSRSTHHILTCFMLDTQYVFKYGAFALARQSQIHITYFGAAHTRPEPVGTPISTMLQHRYSFNR